jgi:hypothetical protein
MPKRYVACQRTVQRMYTGAVAARFHFRRRSKRTEGSRGLSSPQNQQKFYAAVRIPKEQEDIALSGNGAVSGVASSHARRPEGREGFRTRRPPRFPRAAIRLPLRIFGCKFRGPGRIRSRFLLMGGKQGRATSVRSRKSATRTAGTARTPTTSRARVGPLRLSSVSLTSLPSLRSLIPGGKGGRPARTGGSPTGRADRPPAPADCPPLRADRSPAGADRQLSWQVSRLHWQIIRPCRQIANLRGRTARPWRRRARRSGPITRRYGGLPTCAGGRPARAGRAPTGPAGQLLAPAGLLGTAVDRPPASADFGFRHLRNRAA